MLLLNDIEVLRMDFHVRQNRFGEYGNRPVLPFYMTYPFLNGGETEEALLRDLEYLQNTYPAEVWEVAKRVAEILDRVDYEGSMIYDEYPDGYSIGRIARGISDIIQQEEQTGEEMTADPIKKQWLEYLCRVLVGDEIYKRRHGGRRGKFII